MIVGSKIRYFHFCCALDEVTCFTRVGGRFRFVNYNLAVIILWILWLKKASEVGESFL